MELDNEMIEIFIEEVGELKTELTPIYESLKKNPQQPELFTSFAQIIDRIYGTATTMGFVDVGNYLGAVRNVSRKCGTSQIPRGMVAVSKVVKNCMENFDTLQASLKNPGELNTLKSQMDFEIKKITKIETDIFSFCDEATAILTK